MIYISKKYDIDGYEHIVEMWVEQMIIAKHTIIYKYTPDSFVVTYSMSGQITNVILMILGMGSNTLYQHTNLKKLKNY